MANVKITDLTAISAGDLATTDVIPIVDINNDQTKKVQLDELRKFVGEANDFVTFTQLNSNINVVQSNVAATEARRIANVTVFTTEDTALQARIAANALVAASNDFVTFTRLQANIDIVQDNVATVSVGTASDTETRLNANIDVVQDNVAAVESRRGSNVTIQTAIEARRVANVTIMNNEDTALQSRLATNVTALTNEDTALQSRLATNVTSFTNEDTALQARIAANTLVAASNDFITFTRLNANVDVVQDNVASIISGATSFTGNVTILNTGADNVASPILVLDRQSASPADSDYLGRIQFKGKDDGGGTETYGQISGKIIDASAGSEDGAIETAIRKAGSTTIVARQRSDKLQLLNGTELSVDGASEFTGEVTMSDDLIVTGNLTVNGTTTTVSTTNLDVEDRMIMLADGATGSPSLDVGLLFNRGAQGNAAFFYDESAKSFKLSDTKDPKSNTALSPVSASNLDVGIVTAASITLNSVDLSSNLSALAAGIVTAGTSGISVAFPSGDDLDFGVMTGANTTIDAFGVLVGDTYFFDCKEDPKGEVATEDLGALS